MSSSFSEQRDLSYDDSTTSPELARLALLATATGKGSRGRKRIRWCDYLSDFAWPRLGVEPAELLEIAENCELIKS